MGGNARVLPMIALWVYNEPGLAFSYALLEGMYSVGQIPVRKESVPASDRCGMKSWLSWVLDRIWIWSHIEDLIGREVLFVEHEITTFEQGRCISWDITYLGEGYIQEERGCWGCKRQLLVLLLVLLLLLLPLVGWWWVFFPIIFPCVLEKEGSTNGLNSWCHDVVLCKDKRQRCLVMCVAGDLNIHRRRPFHVRTILHVFISMESSLLRLAHHLFSNIIGTEERRPRKKESECSAVVAEERKSAM